LFDRPISGRSYALKLVEDLAFAGIALLFMAPLMLVIAAAINLDSPGPVLFKQRRFGFNNNLIEVWKFRTMRTDCADADADVQTTKQDPRVTRVGQFLRKSSLDELPQLINVLRGEMSIVGPRPHAVATKAEGQLFENVVYGYAARHRVKPGITGWAQVNGWRGETDTIDKIRKRVEHDLYYIDHWSVWLDLYIMVKTCLVVFRDENAY
jgi:exopolysaccharide biosynthesis polyprenyl glycosylphosphotransferase